MKIAIAAPSPVPFGVGGAEKLWWGMQDYFNRHTPHQCELIKLPVQEDGFWPLIDSYKKFYRLDLSSFDRIITGKYPAWMVQHPNHQIYMLHCLRGLYDDWPVPPPQCPPACHTGLAGDEVYAFPGPFIRELVHFFDQQAMAGVKQFSAISGTVAQRKAYFPANAAVAVIYPPSSLTGFANRADDCFFTASRLDHAKRIDMIIKAYQKSHTRIPLKIAGTGPLESELKALAGNDPRIEFLGFISDDDLMAWYARAYAVIFVPKQEDYGLITIEAMRCEKPVLTVSDAGGVLEFVSHGTTGWVCPPDIPALTAAIDDLSQDPDRCRAMGRAAAKKVSPITWKSSMDTLIAAPLQRNRDKIVVASTYPVYPPRGGGQNRIFYLYRALARHMDVELVCLTCQGDGGRREIAPGIWETRVPKTPRHGQKEHKIEQRCGIPVTDMAMLLLAHETPQFLAAVMAAAKDAKCAVSSHPYLFSLLKDHLDIPVIHESHNVEYQLKSQMVKTNPPPRILELVRQAEAQACKAALFTTVCSKEDGRAMETCYGLDPDKTVWVPNGVDLSTVPFVTKAARHRLKKKLGLADETLLLFMGSWHQPNIDAVTALFPVAQNTPEYRYIILGGVGAYFAGRKTPDNMGFTGIVDDREKALYLSIVDGALNPMPAGSGTNLKMLDYMAAGIPVITTPTGARGLDIPKGAVAVAEIQTFHDIIPQLDAHTDIHRARAHAAEHFSWEGISSTFLRALSDRCGVKPLAEIGQNEPTMSR